MRANLMIVLTLAALGGCSKKQTKVEEPTPDVPVTTADKPAAAAETPSTPASPNIGVSSDLATRCALKTSSEVPPNFDYNQVELLPEDKAILEQIATCLTTGPLKGHGLNLIGRADPRGTEEYNMGLGARRAQTVSDYLSKLGVTSPQLAETTRGALEATGTDEASWQKDRRVDLELRDP